jgi:type I restriction enzyme S subunit
MQMYCTTPAGRSFLSGRASSASDGKFNINTQILKGVMIPLPSLDEQRQIVEMVSSVVQHEAATAKQANARETLFKSLLHHLMTGKVRVNELEFPAMKEGSP